MTSLGYRIGGEGIPAPKRKIVQPIEDPVLPPPSLAARLKCEMKVPKGFLILLLYSAYAALLPLLYFYVEYDFASTMTRGGVIGASTLLALVAILANDCCTWYNMVLLYHTAIEVKVLDTVLTYAMADTTDDVSMAWSWIGAAIVIVHLLPFFLVDWTRLLLVLAFAGVPVNAALAVYLDTAVLPVVVPSAAFLLFMTFIVTGIQGLKPSMLSKLRIALTEGGWLVC